MLTSSTTVVELAQKMADDGSTVFTLVPDVLINGNLVGDAEFKVHAGPLSVASFVEGDWFTATQDTASAWVIVDGDLTIGTGQVFRPAARKLFTVVYVNGDLVLDGVISMSQRGANHSGDAYSGGLTEPVDILVQSGVTIPALGGVGGASPGRQNTAVGNAGGTTVAGSGGGGSGASRWCASYGPADAGGGPGAQGTCFSGGSGGGGARAVSSAYCAAGAYGGPGGRASVDVSGWPDQGGGAGNPPLEGTYGVLGGVGTGGTLIVIVTGAISGAGSLTAAGAAGGNAAAPDNASGGGSGGGIIVALKGSGADPVMSASGGTGGSTSYAGGGGGAGATIAATAVIPVRVTGEPFVAQQTALDGAISTPRTVIGEAWSSSVVALGAANPIKVSGDSFVSGAAALSGSVNVTLAGEVATGSVVMLDGTAVVTPFMTVLGEPFAAAAIALDGFPDLGEMLGLWILDDEVERAPTSVQVTLVGGTPTAVVTFDIDGVDVFTATTDSDGALTITSVPVPVAQGAAGSHTLTATQVGSRPSSATFTILRDPPAANRVVGPDAAPVEVPEANTATGVRRWVLQDLMPGGLGSYVMPMNPSSMTNPHFQRSLESQHVVANAGAHHVFESDLAAQEWTFTGYCPDQAMHDKLVAFGDLNRRFYVLDHRGRAWTVTFTEVDLVPRLRQRNGATWNDWAHNYTVRAVVYDQDWEAPQ